MSKRQSCLFTLVRRSREKFWIAATDFLWIEAIMKNMNCDLISSILESLNPEKVKNIFQGDIIYSRMLPASLISVYTSNSPRQSLPETKPILDKEMKKIVNESVPQNFYSWRQQKCFHCKIELTFK